jgi:hypothetical protein
LNFQILFSEFKALKVNVISNADLPTWVALQCHLIHKYFKKIEESVSMIPESEFSHRIDRHAARQQDSEEGTFVGSRP